MATNIIVPGFPRFVPVPNTADLILEPVRFKQPILPAAKQRRSMDHYSPSGDKVIFTVGKAVRSTRAKRDEEDEEEENRVKFQI